MNEWFLIYPICFLYCWHSIGFSNGPIFRVFLQASSCVLLTKLLPLRRFLQVRAWEKSLCTGSVSGKLIPESRSERCTSVTQKKGQVSHQDFLSDRYFLRSFFWNMSQNYLPMGQQRSIYGLATIPHSWKMASWAFIPRKLLVAHAWPLSGFVPRVCTLWASEKSQVRKKRS